VEATQNLKKNKPTNKQQNNKAIFLRKKRNVKNNTYEILEAAKQPPR
jgi:hypothetical protein